MPLAQAVKSLQPLPLREHWARYAAGAIRVLAHHGGESAVCGGAVCVHGALPSMGVSSSAAVTCALLHVLGRGSGLALSDDDVVRLAWRVERLVLGLRNGVLDFGAVVHGRRNALLHTVAKRSETMPDDIFRDSHQFNVLPAGGDDSAAPLVMLVDSGVSRELTERGDYNNRVDQCCEAAKHLAEEAGVEGVAVLGDLPRTAFDEHGVMLAAKDPALHRRASHFFSEVARVERGCTAWKDGDLYVSDCLVICVSALQPLFHFFCSFVCGHFSNF